MWFMVKNLYREVYTPNWLSQFVHNWPHISYKTFTKYNSTFAPYDDKYVETLLFWAGMPIVWLGFCIVALLLFSCCLCLKRNQPVNIRKGIIRLRWWLIITMLLCVTSIGVCFYGNGVTAAGIHHYVQATEGANETVMEIESIVNDIDNEMESVGTASDELLQRLPDCTSNDTALNILRQFAEDVKVVSQKITANISGIEDKFDTSLFNGLVSSSDSIREYHLWGWSIFIGLLCVDIALCLAVILCTAKSLRGGIIFCCILLIIAFTLVWIVIGGELFLTVALSDFCVAPEQFIYSEGRKYNTDKDILYYYVECNDPVASPFKESFSLANSLYDKAQKDIDNIDRDCSQSESVTEIVMGLYSLFGEFHQSMEYLKVIANCRLLNENYKWAIFSLCYNSLSGLGYQVLFGAILGMLWLIAICQGTLLASRLGRRKMNYDGGQEDPFLPPRDGAATLERYSARREQPSTSGVGRRPTSAVSQRGSSLISQSNVTVPDDLPPSYTLAISRDRPNQRGGNRQVTESLDNSRYSGASLV
ncbi:protein tweety homolog 1-B-like isoform X2 [Apostichopus japonicus]|uniref:protein tweety homolog 1-B-like isoform X2 n=1 Tax=Stichopus japonicus TaxID=307972 RepID=UPI003AB4DE80